MSRRINTVMVTSLISQKRNTCWVMSHPIDSIKMTTWGLGPTLGMIFRQVIDQDINLEETASSHGVAQTRAGFKARDAWEAGEQPAVGVTAETWVRVVGTVMLSRKSNQNKKKGDWEEVQD